MFRISDFVIKDCCWRGRHYINVYHYSVYTKSRECMVIYMCVKGIYSTSVVFFNDFLIGFRNSSDCVIFFIFYIIHYKLLMNIVLYLWRKSGRSAFLETVKKKKKKCCSLRHLTRGSHIPMYNLGNKSANNRRRKIILPIILQ